VGGDIGFHGFEDPKVRALVGSWNFELVQSPDKICDQALKCISCIPIPA
jgi:hypothetical protein